MSTGPDHESRPTHPGHVEALSTLREQMAETLAAWQTRVAVVCEHTQVISYGAAVDALMPLVEATLDGQMQRAEQAELDASRAEAQIQRVRNAIASATWPSAMVRVQTIRDAIEQPKEGS